MKSRDARILRWEWEEKNLNEKAKKLEDEKRAADKRVYELKRVTAFEASLNKACEDLAAMERMKEEVEESALTRVSNIENNMLEQVRLLAPDVDFSKVSAYNKVVDG
ncbi:hypothetical protein PIB30_068892 [Stylosanthes scabra]|uniref:Uncharacterized protein n=1 Tax=Stylosanthes scabra TaxID=79078 RepID=A0ABU6SPG0_9FABA|nr:hypothetical protein [Stylosanthes scabra]